jgi:hypothetical protein
MRSVSGIGLTPFILTRLGATHRDPSHRKELRQSRSGSINPAEMEANAEADSLPSSPLHSDFNSQSFQFVPVGLSTKELARMRAVNLRAQPTIGVTPPPVSDESRPPSVSLPAPVATTSKDQRYRRPFFRQCSRNLIAYGTRSNNFVQRDQARKLRRAMGIIVRAWFKWASALAPSPA